MPGSSLAYRSRNNVQPNRDFFRNPFQWEQYAVSGTIDLTNTVLADADSAALYLADDFLEVGTLLSFIAVGAGPAYAGLWVPYLPNITVDAGEATPDGVLFEPGFITRDQVGTIEGTVMIASILPAGTPAQVFASKAPAYNDFTAYVGGAGSTTAVATGDLPSGFVNLDDFGITNVGGL